METLFSVGLDPQFCFVLVFVVNVVVCLFCRISFNWDLTVFVIIILRLYILGRKATKLKCHSHQGCILLTYNCRDIKQFVRWKKAERGN